jgi:quercetin dioxygenase-like cupin family protein
MITGRGCYRTVRGFEANRSSGTLHPESGAEHYLIRYPAGLKVRVHRHTAAQTIVVLEGPLVVNDQVIG